MRAAIFLRDVVGVAVHALLVGVIPLQRHFDRGGAFLGAKPEHAVLDRRATAVQMTDEGFQSALVLEDVGLVLALVDQLDAHAGVQERQFAQPVGQRVVHELDVGKDLGGGLEADGGPPLLCRTHFGERCHRLSEPVFLAVELAVPGDRQLQDVGQRVDHRDADAMQAAGHFVGTIVEFSA